MGSAAISRLLLAVAVAVVVVAAAAAAEYCQRQVQGRLTLQEKGSRAEHCVQGALGRIPDVVEVAM